MTLQGLPKFSQFEDFVDGQMFLCNIATQEECLDGCLFGSPRNKWPEVQQITKKTAIFLYTVGEQPTLHGIFTAVGQPFLDMDTKAFGGRFPSQVRVKLFYKFPAIPGGNLRKMLKGDRNRQRRLTRRQTHEIVASMISYTYNRNDAGVLERLKQQSEKSSANRTVQPPVLSSGTPVFIYDPRNTRLSLTNSKIPLPTNSNRDGLPSIALGFQPSAKGECKPQLPFSQSKTSPLKVGIMSRCGQRRVLSSGFFVTREFFPQYLYFPVLAQAKQHHPNKLLSLKKSTELGTKLFVGNLHNTITKDDLRMSFSNFGKILESEIQKNLNGNSMGSGWVEFENPSDAAWAIESVNGMLIAGLPVIVCPWSGGLE